MEKKLGNQEIMDEMKKKYEEYPLSEKASERIQEGIRQANMELCEETDQKTKSRSLGKACRMIGLVAAAALLVITVLVNSSADIALAMERIPVIGAIAQVVIFRDYQYESERRYADVEVPEIVMTDPSDDVETPEIVTTDPSADVIENMNQSTEEINAEIQEITDRFIEEFEESLQYEWGYLDIMIDSEVVNTTEQYFTLKLICYQGAGSSTEWNYYYTIDLTTGERLQLKSLFMEGADYITPISENIKEQMRRQMDEDESKYYWLDDEIEELNFKQIGDDTEFYLNEKGNIVISFNEGDVAPMYMGVVTFEIPNDTVKDILK